MIKVAFVLFVSGYLVMSDLAIAKDCKCVVKEYVCEQNFYNSAFTIRFEKHKRPILISSWKLSEGNISGRPDYLYTGNKLKPRSKKSSDITQYAMKGNFIGVRYLNIFANEKNLESLTDFEANDYPPANVLADPDFRAVCTLKN